MATEVNVADQSSTTVREPQLQEVQVDQKEAEVEKVEKKPDMTTMEATTNAVDIQEDNVVTEENPSVLDTPVIKAEGEAGEKQEEGVVSSKPVVDVPEVEASNSKEMTEEAIIEPEQASVEEPTAEKVEEKGAEVTAETQEEENREVVFEATTDVDVSEAVVAESPSEVQEPSEVTPVMEHETEAESEKTTETSVIANASDEPEEVKDDVVPEEEKLTAETEAAEAVDAEQSNVGDTEKVGKPEVVNEETVIKEENPTAETQAADAVDDTLKVQEAAPAAEEESKEVKVSKEKAANVAEPTVEEADQKTEEATETDPAGEQVVDVKDLTATDYPKYVEESKSEAIVPVEEETKECNNAPKTDELVADQSTEAKEAEPIVEDVKEPEKLEEVVKDRDISPAETVEQAVENSEIEKKEENSEGAKRTSLGDMIKEDNEVKQGEEIAAEPTVAAPEQVKSDNVRTDVIKSEEADAVPTPSTGEQETSRDIEVTPPSSEENKEEKPASVLEAEKNGNVEEAAMEEANVKTEEKSKDEGVSKPASKTILSKVKNSLAKAKKAIIGKSPSSKTITTDVTKVE